MKEVAYQKQIEQMIAEAESGTLFVISDFTHIASYDCVNMILLRLERSGTLRRVIRGIYEKPDYNEFLGEYVSADPDKVAHAIARNFGWTIVPCGDTALNALGLSTQIPAVWMYVSDGAYKTYSFENTVIKFKRTTNKDISKFSYKTALVVQAVKALGKDNIDGKVIGRLRSALSEEDQETMLSEARTATAWIYEYIKLICRGGKE